MSRIKGEPNFRKGPMGLYGTRDEIIQQIVKRCDKDGSCLLWRNMKDFNGGYAIVRIARRTMKVHLLMWQLSAKSALAEGLALVNKCGSRHCVEPSHWRCVPKEDVPRLTVKGLKRSADTIIRSTLARRRRGRMTIEAAREIRASEEPTGVLAERYGVDRSRINAIRAGRTWRELTTIAPHGI